MSSPLPTVGHEVHGTGPAPVIVLNDWLCDTSTWDGARRYLDAERFTYAFTDLRGYGRSRALRGEYRLVEAASDVLALADSKQWPRFVVVGHSMSTLIALHLGQHHPDRVHAVVAITPPPPDGFHLDAEALKGSEALGRADLATKRSALKQRFAGRLSPGWADFKARRWFETADPEAVAAYAAMFSRDGLPDLRTRVRAPVLAITGEQDMELMRSAAVTRALTPLCERLTVQAISESGHYPMEETPPLLVAHLERFLTSC